MFFRKLYVFTLPLAVRCSVCLESSCHDCSSNLLMNSEQKVNSFIRYIE